MSGTRAKHDQRRERPHRTANSRPGPCGLRGSLPPLAAGRRSSCFARMKEFCKQSCMRRRMQLCLQDRIAEGGNALSLVKPPPKKPKSASLQVRIDEDVRQKLDLYAQFIESAPSYVVAEALKLLFNRDAEFKRWLGQHTNSSLVPEINPKLKGEESLVDRFKLA